jgi:hypothetical protein
MRTRKLRPYLFAAGAALSLSLLQWACTPDRPTVNSEDGFAGAASLAGNPSPGTHLQYGVPITLGEGKVRTYVVLDEKTGRRPLEIGVAIDAKTMEGKLPNETLWIPMEFPEHVPEPYKFMLFDWNPQGHAPPGVYDLPHFDFHFYWMPHAEVQAITRDDPNFDAKANNLPGEGYIPPYYDVPAPPGMTPAMLAEPGMGLHWDDMRSPQLQRLLGNDDAFQPFTKTLIYGTWDGVMTFVEPMITREYLMRRTDEVIPFPRPMLYPKPGWYPGAYRIYHDSQKKEYRVAIVDLEWRE